jgi:hypothetical protein
LSSFNNVLFILYLANIFCSSVCCWFLILFWWADRKQGVILIFLYLLRLAFSTELWSILENVPWGYEMNAYYVALFIFIYIKTIVLLYSVDYLWNLFIAGFVWINCVMVRVEVLKLPTIIVFRSISVYKYRSTFNEIGNAYIWYAW